MTRKTARKLMPPRMKLAEFARSVFQVRPELGTTVEDILAPEFWTHVAGQLQPRARIEVETEDMAWWAELYVVAVEPLPGNKFHARVVPLRMIDLTAEPEALAVPAATTTAAAAMAAEAAAAPSVLDGDPADYEVAFKGPAKRHVIIRKADRVVMREGIATKAEAQAMIDAIESESPAI